MDELRQTGVRFSGRPQPRSWSWLFLLGGALVAALLGGQLVGRRPGDGRAGGRVPTRGAAWRARRPRGAVLPERRYRLPHQAARRDPGGGPSDLTLRSPSPVRGEPEGEEHDRHARSPSGSGEGVSPVQRARPARHDADATPTRAGSVCVIPIVPSLPGSGANEAELAAAGSSLWMAAAAFVTFVLSGTGRGGGPADAVVEPASCFGLPSPKVPNNRFITEGG